jgi:hypothetical protein
MSAAAPRATAPWHRTARAEAQALLWSPWTPILLIGIVLPTVGPIVVGKSPFVQILELTLMMFFLPLLLWRGKGVRGALDQAMPVGTAAYELIRIGVGAAAALVVLCIATQAHVWGYVSRFKQPELAGFAPGYAGALIIRGLAVYLFASAIVLRARRPGRVLLAAFVLGSVALLFLGGAEMTTEEVQYARDGTVTAARYGSSLTLGKALVQLAVGAAAVGLSVALGRREGALLLPWRRAGGTAPALRTTRVPRTALSLPRRTASMGAVAVRQLAVQAPRMTWPLLVAAGFALWYTAQGMGVGGAAGHAVSMDSFAVLWFLAFFCPPLVWMDERGGRPWDEAQPADTFVRRMAHAAAGLVWLELCAMLQLAGHAAGALAAGTPLSLASIPAWVMPGVPLALMALYCVGSLPAVLSDHPVGASVITSMLFFPALTAIPLVVWGTFTERSPLSPLHLLLPTPLASTPWSILPALLWLPLLVALAVAAIRHRVALDRGGSAVPRTAGLHPSSPSPAGAS